MLKRENIVRIGTSTWYGNLRMIKLAKKQAMKKEIEYQKTRIVKGEYFSSISYGILKENWVQQIK